MTLLKVSEKNVISSLWVVDLIWLFQNLDCTESLSVQAFWSGHSGSFGHLYWHNAVQLLHSSSDESAEVDGWNVAATSPVVVVTVLQPARLEAITCRPSWGRINVEEASDEVLGLRGHVGEVLVGETEVTAQDVWGRLVVAVVKEWGQSAEMISRFYIFTASKKTLRFVKNWLCPDLF